MDFENLAKHVNKEVLKWTIDDVTKWLGFIGLDTFQSIFSNYFNNLGENGIDGSIL